LEGSLVVGGESFRRQADELRRGVDYIVATPGRLNDHLKERTMKLSQVAILVLDEVDRMLDMGFLPQIKEVLKYLPVTRQTLLFSATLPQEVARFVDPLVSEPVRVSVGDSARPIGLVTEKVIQIRNEQKGEYLLRELATTKGKVLVFVRTKSRTKRVARLLEGKGLRAVCLHGGRSQAQRKQALERFRNGSHPILVATDLAGRGLDIIDIDRVVNFDVPMTREDYIHRLGRAGRAGRAGSATSFVEIGNADEERIVTGKKTRKEFLYCSPASPRGSHQKYR
jgi:superfamily II DNA/RNA helicase